MVLARIFYYLSFQENKVEKSFQTKNSEKNQFGFHFSNFFGKNNPE